VLALAVLTWSSRLTRLLVILFLLIIVLALGPRLIIGTRQLATLPWAGLWSLPAARSAEPVRFILLGYLVLAIILAVWLAIPTRNRWLLAARWILALAAVAAILGNLPTASSVIDPSIPATAAAQPANALPAFISTGLYRDYLRPGETVLVLSDRGNAGMLFQADTNFYMRVAGASSTSRYPVRPACRRPSPCSSGRPRPGSGGSGLTSVRPGWGPSSSSGPGQRPGCRSSAGWACTAPG